MEGDKPESSDNLSDETDRPEEDSDDFGTKRSYQCTFCRRGFTNAQALGGHMNIHRKDRDKAKHVSVDSAIPTKTYEDHFSTRYMAEQTKYYPVFESQRNYYHPYYQSSPSNPRCPPFSYSFEHSFLASRRTHAQPLSQELLGANLSLGMGLHHAEENPIRVGVKSDGEVDLELRLGYHQY